MIGFERMPDGRVAVELAREERDLLAQLVGQLPTVLDGGRDDPAVARLLPDAHRHDAAASEEFRELTERSLVDGKRADAVRVGAALARVGDTVRGGSRVELDDELVISWLRTLTDLRLVVASRLGIEHDDDAGAPDEGMRMVYDWLGYLQESLLHAIDDPA